MTVGKAAHARHGSGTATVVEWAPFRLASGVSESDLMSAADALQAGFLDAQPGFVSRDLLRGEDGRWIDLLYWTDQESVATAMQRIMDSSVAQRYFQLIAPDDPAGSAVGPLFFRLQKTYTHPDDIRMAR